MADPFIGVIKTTLEALGYANVINQNSPSWREWDTNPVVLVCPSPKNSVDYISFGLTKTIQSYDCYFLFTANLASDFNNSADDFYQGILSQFMPQNVSMLAAGAYMSRVKPKYDYDRSIYPLGWNSTCVTIDVFTVNQ